MHVLVRHCLRCALWLLVAIGGLASSAQAQDPIFADGFDPRPSITTQPANATVTAGQTATFGVTASGTAPLTYQWRSVL